MSLRSHPDFMRALARAMEIFPSLGAELQDGVKEFITDVGKSEAEIQQYTVDENLDEVDRSIFLLSKGFPVQKSTAIANLPLLLQSHPTQAMERVLPFVLKTLESLDEAAQADAATAFTLIFSNLDLPNDAFATLASVVLTMAASPIQDVAQEWLGVLLCALPKLDDRVIRQEILPFVSDTKDIGGDRSLLCKIMGAMAQLLTSSEIKKGFLDKALSMCQDVDLYVRATMCLQLDPIARGIGLPTAKARLIKELLELSKDEEIEVRKASLETMTNLLDFFDDETKQEVLPIFQSTLHELHPGLIHCIASLLGKLVGALADPAMKTFVCSVFSKLARHQTDPTVRTACCHALPSMIVGIGPQNYADRLHDTFRSLAVDELPAVREVVAKTFHVISRLLGNEGTMTYLKDIFLRLIQDKESSVRIALLENMRESLDSFFKATQDCKKQAAFYNELLPHLLAYDGSFGAKWRNEVKYLQAMQDFHKFYSSDQVVDVFIPRLFRLMANGVNPVKAEAGMVTVIFLRNCAKLAQRKELCQRLIREFGRSRTCWHRMHFLDVCTHIVELFSRQFFKTNFLDAVLDLSKDPVPNIRLRTCHLLPMLKRTLQLPDDATLLHKFNSIAKQFKFDEDRDVLAIACEMDRELSRIDITPHSDPDAEDIKDKEKLKWEEKLTHMEEQLFQEMKKRIIEDVTVGLHVDDLHSKGPWTSKPTVKMGVMQGKPMNPPNKGRLRTLPTPRDPTPSPTKEKGDSDKGTRPRPTKSDQDVNTNKTIKTKAGGDGIGIQQKPSRQPPSPAASKRPGLPKDNKMSSTTRLSPGGLRRLGKSPPSHGSTPPPA